MHLTTGGTEVPENMQEMKTSSISAQLMGGAMFRFKGGVALWVFDIKYFRRMAWSRELIIHF